MADSSTDALRKALEDAARLRQENAQLHQRATQATSQAFGEADARISAQESAIDSQIASAETAHAQNQREWERLQAEGDFKGAGDAMSRMIAASTSMATLRAQKDQLATQRGSLEQHRAQQQPQNTGAPQTDPLDGLTGAERDWVARNPAYLTDTDFQGRAAGAADYAMRTLKLRRDSAEYFDFIDKSVNGAPATDAAPAMSIGAVDAGNQPTDDVAMPSMPQPQQPRPVAVNPDDDGTIRMVDEMFPQHRAAGRDGNGIRQVAAPPSRVVRQLSDQIRRGRAIEPTMEELETARTLAIQIDPEIASRGDEEIVRWYYNLYHSPSSQRKLKRWYGREAA